MRKLLLLLLTLVLVFPAVSVAEETTTVTGYVMERAAFYQMEEAFRTLTFEKEMHSIELTGTQTLMYIPQKTNAMVPSLTVLIQEPVGLADDVDEMVSIVQSVLDTLLYLQSGNPDAFLFNHDLAAEYEETGMSFAVAEPEVWLWADDGRSVMLPIYFYDNTNGNIIGDVYLFTITHVSESSGYCALYTDPEPVVDYLMSVEMNTASSAFQSTVIGWYLANFVEDETRAQGTDTAENSLGEAAPVTGNETEAAGGPEAVVIAVRSGNARSEGDTNAKIVGVVQKGQVYDVLSVSSKGWYEIELSSGERAYISPALVEKTK